jgi:hypothetical protein
LPDVIEVLKPPANAVGPQRRLLCHLASFEQLKAKSVDSEIVRPNLRRKKEAVQIDLVISFTSF